MVYTPSIAADVYDTENALPKEFMLWQNFPNPFNPVTTISFDLPNQSHVRLTVFDILGRTTRVLWDQVLSPGHHSVEWDGKDSGDDDMASGIYLYRLATDSFTDVKKMALIR
jgi:hypothetical protein